jgi:hypothetical protein
MLPVCCYTQIRSEESVPASYKCLHRLEKTSLVAESPVFSSHYKILTVVLDQARPGAASIDEVAHKKISFGVVFLTIASLADMIIKKMRL